MTKERLNQYRQLVKEVAELKERIAILEARCEGGAIVITDMPRGGKRSDNYVKLGDAVRKLIDLERGLEDEMVAIEEYIKQIPDSITRTIFRYRYINGMTWEDVGEKIGYCERQVRRLHNKYYYRMS